jgi:hypothetical protein
MTIPHKSPGDASRLSCLYLTKQDAEEHDRMATGPALLSLLGVDKLATVSRQHAQLYEIARYMKCASQISTPGQASVAQELPPP